jgi:hypothetical protein
MNRKGSASGALLLAFRGEDQRLNPPAARRVAPLDGAIIGGRAW